MKNSRKAMLVAVLLVGIAAQAQQPKPSENPRNAAFAYWQAFAEMKDFPHDYAAKKLVGATLEGTAP